MNFPRTDFASRISVRATAAGVLVTFSVMLLSMLLAGGLGVWGFDLSAIPKMGTGFWIWSFIMLFFAGNLLANLPENVASPILWGFFVADLTALGTAVVGGMNGAYSESKFEILEKSGIQRSASPRLDQALAKT